MKKRSLVWFFRSLVAVAVVICLPPRAWAQVGGGDARAAFSQAYAAYTAAIEAGDHASALTAAKRAYENGSAHFGRVNDNTGALAMNYGNTLALSGADNAAAAEVFREADAIYEELHGASSLQRLEALLALASVQETLEDRLASINAALSMHRAVLPDEHIAYARLQSHGGELLASVWNGTDEARRMLEDALNTLEEEYGADSPELFPTLLALATNAPASEAPGRRQLALFERTVEIARTTDSDEDVADLELEIAYRLGRQFRGYEDAMPYARSALGVYERLFGADHPKTALATLTLGQAFVATGDSEQGESTVAKATQFYEGKPEYASNLIRARQLLMSVYAARGDEERYTEQLMEVGRLSEGLPTPVEYLPIVKAAPVYPVEAARCGADGYVMVQYTVDEQGQVRDPVVVQSDNTCGGVGVFDQAAITSTLKYRYLPRFENGVAVSVPGVTTRIIFEIL
ncbi:MAG TPA: TonB family protein [Gammaproteobacteria bacterium]|nr:TonB family protein [Gammaproteobacteria bacterium]